MLSKTREQKVKEFHEAGKQGYEDMPLSELFRQRYNLMEEELREVDEAMCTLAAHKGSADEYRLKASELLKELCDLQYVLSGTVESMGWTDNFDAAFNRVHKNNMTKFAEGIKYDDNGKILKPTSFKKADLRDLV